MNSRYVKRREKEEGKGKYAAAEIDKKQQFGGGGGMSERVCTKSCKKGRPVPASAMAKANYKQLAAAKAGFLPVGLTA